MLSKRAWITLSTIWDFLDSSVLLIEIYHFVNFIVQEIAGDGILISYSLKLAADHVWRDDKAVGSL